MKGVIRYGKSERGIRRSGACRVRAWSGVFFFTWYIHCSKYLRDQIFKGIYLEKYWGKILPDCSPVESFCLIMQLWHKKIAKLCFLHNPEGNHPQNTSVLEPLHSWPLPFKTRSNTIALFIVKSVAGMTTCLTLNYANFAPLNVSNIAPLHVCIMLR